MNNDLIFHAIEILIQGGILLAVIRVIWKAASIIQEFRNLKEIQDAHIEDDKKQFFNLNTNLGRLQQGVARIEGRLGK